MENLVWVVVILCCVGSQANKVLPCSTPLSISHGSYHLSHDTLSVKYECNDGFYAHGEPKADCINGHWSERPPTCVAPGCEGLIALANGYLTLSYSGAVANFRCSDGFILQGPEVLVCDGHSWNGTQPECKDPREDQYRYKTGKHHTRHHKDGLFLLDADYSCIERGAVVQPPHVAHAVRELKWSIMEEKPRLYIHFRCKWGFTLQGEDTGTTVYCRERQWIGKLPRCVTEPPSTNAVGSRVQGDDPSAHPQTHDDWIRYADYTCFDARKEATAPEVAHALRLPRFRHIDSALHLYVQYECQPGYSIQYGDEYLYCRDQRWLGVLPTCGVDLSDPRLPSCDRSNGGCAHTCSMEKGRVQCSCQIGFRLGSNGHSCEDVNECETDNGGCVQLCFNNAGHYRCGCKSGFYLSLDGRSCLEKKRSSQTRDKPPLVLFHV